MAPALHLAAADAWLAPDKTWMDARFGPNANFQSATFSGNATFGSATFSGNANFGSATFSGDANFESAIFSGIAYFLSATFSEYAGFGGATFSGYASFQSVTFSGDATFVSAIFSGDATFGSATFSGNANFHSATFSGDAGFSKTVFGAAVDFEGALFLGVADFAGRGATLFNPDRESALEWRSSEDGVGRSTGTLTTEGGPTAAARRSFRRCVFSEAVFWRDAHFTNRDILEPSQFARTRFFGVARFQGSKLVQGVSFFGAEFDAELRDARPDADPQRLDRLYAAYSANASRPAADRLDRAAWESDLRAEWETWRADPLAVRSERNTDADRERRRNERAAQLEAAYQTLKLAMEANRERNEEQRFFRLELLARRRRTDDAVPRWERLLSDAYGWTSDFGGSVFRPLERLMLLSLSMAAVYVFAACLAEMRWPVVISPGRTDVSLPFEALTFSAETVFRPFHYWTDRALAENGQLTKALFSAEGVDGGGAWGGLRTGFSFLMRVIATLQSFAAIVLLFLTALAVRRKFQIN